MNLFAALRTRTARLANHTVLLGSILLVLLGWPIISEFGLGPGWVLDLVLIVVIAACLTEVLDRGTPIALLILLILAHEVVRALGGIPDGKTADTVRHGLLFVAMILTVFYLLRGVLRSRVVDAHTLLGAICVYLLLGLSWTELYALIDVHDPEAFRSAVEVGATRLDARVTLPYFSMVTLTTLGYGDVIPVNAIARSLAGLEAAVGQLYIAIIVARLVASYVSTSNRSKEAGAVGG